MVDTTTGRKPQRHLHSDKILNGNLKENGPIKTKDGKMFITEEERKNRWTEHFKEVCNRPSIRLL